MIRFAEGLKVLPILTPAASTAARASEYIDLENCHWVSIHALLGAMTSDSTDTITFTVEVSTAASSNATEIKVPFNYRLSAAVQTDTMGAITAAAAATGVAVNATDDNKLLCIDIDPSVIPSLTGYVDHKFLRLVLTPVTELATAYSVGAVLYAEPRYKGNSIPSST